jgi:hypothetical protein
MLRSNHILQRPIFWFIYNHQTHITNRSLGDLSVLLPTYLRSALLIEKYAEQSRAEQSHGM